MKKKTKEVLLLILEVIPDIQIIMSKLINWEDCEGNNQISSINNPWKTQCNSKGFSL